MVFIGLWIVYGLADGLKIVIINILTLYMFYIYFILFLHKHFYYNSRKNIF